MIVELISDDKELHERLDKVFRYGNFEFRNTYSLNGFYESFLEFPCDVIIIDGYSLGDEAITWLEEHNDMKASILLYNNHLPLSLEGAGADSVYDYIDLENYLFTLGDDDASA